MANRPINSSSVDSQMLPETWSTSRTQAITGAHNFVVTNFSLLDGIGTGEHVSSGTFSVGGCDWSIRFYPDGNAYDAAKDGKAAAAAYASVHLFFLDGPPTVRVTFSISLFDDKDSQGSSGKKGKKKTKKRSSGQGGEQVPRSLTRTGTRTYDKEDHRNWGWGNFIEKSTLKEMRHGFTIRCVVTVLKPRTEDGAAMPAPPSDLHQDFARMLEVADGADITVSVGDRFFLAHRYVLAARSRVFRAQLFGAMKESAAECIRIEDMEPCVFERLLHFIYTDSLPEESCGGGGDDGEALAAMQRLLVAADRYELKRLSLMCEAKLTSWIGVQSVATILGLADQHQRVLLKQACLRFIAWPEVLGAVMQTHGFKDLIDSCPLIMKEILEKIAQAG